MGFGTHRVQNVRCIKVVAHSEARAGPRPGPSGSRPDALLQTLHRLHGIRTLGFRLREASEAHLMAPCTSFAKRKDLAHLAVLVEKQAQTSYIEFDQPYREC